MMLFSITYLTDPNLLHDSSYISKIGAPYVATARDMYNIVTKWCEFVPQIRHLLSPDDFMAVRVFLFFRWAAHSFHTIVSA